jgi:hypothetical protein
MLSSPDEATLSFKGNLCTKDSLGGDGLITLQLDLNAVAARSERPDVPFFQIKWRVFA